MLEVEIAVPSALVQYLTTQNLSIPPSVSGFALIDTGATRSCIDEQAVSTLGVNPIGTTTTMTAAGPVQQSLYPARLRFPVHGFEVEFNSAIGVNLKGQGVGDKPLIALIGRDILAKTVFIYNGFGGFFTFAY
ncbi:MAG: aspartyl protease family protein [Planctomycetes bacterium]|nr:aspartyl protease family protein [Planctomycetota bacterium]